MLRSRNSGKEEWSPALTPIRADEEVDPDDVKQTSNQFHAQLYRIDSVFNQILAYPRLNNVISLEELKHPLKLGAVFGIILYVLNGILFVLSGDAFGSYIGRILYDNGISPAVIQVLGFVFIIGLAMLVTNGLWVGFWKFIRMLPSEARSNAVVSTEINGTSEDDTADLEIDENRDIPESDDDMEPGPSVAPTHSVRNVDHTFAKQLWGNLYGDKTELRSVREIRPSSHRIYTDSKDIRMAELYATTASYGDEFGPSTDPNKLLSAGSDERHSPIANITRVIANAPHRIHLQTLSSPVIGGESRRNEAIARHSGRELEPEDHVRPEQLKGTSGQYMANTIRILVEFPEGDKDADEWAQKKIKTLIQEVSKLTAAGVQIKRKEGSTLNNPSIIDEPKNPGPFGPRRLNIVSGINRYRSRVFDPDNAITLEAETALLLHAVPGDAGRVTNQSIRMKGVHEVSPSSLTPGEEYELMSEYNPAPGRAQ